MEALMTRGRVGSVTCFSTRIASQSIYLAFSPRLGTSNPSTLFCPQRLPSSLPHSPGVRTRPQILARCQSGWTLRAVHVPLRCRVRCHSRASSSGETSPA